MPPSYLNHPPPSLARAPPRLLFSLHWKGVHNQDDAPTTGSGSGSASATSIPLPPPPSPSPSPHPITAIGWLAASGGCSSGADADADAGAGLAFAVYRCSAAEADRNPEVQYSTAQEQYRTVALQYSTMQYSTYQVQCNTMQCNTVQCITSFSSGVRGKHGTKIDKGWTTIPKPGCAGHHCSHPSCASRSSCIPL